MFSLPGYICVVYFLFSPFENHPGFIIGQGSEKIVLDRQISFSELMVDVDLEAHRLLLQQVDLPLSYPEILVLCQSYSLVDPSFVPKLAKVDIGSRFLILMGVGRVMGMFLAFSSGQIPSAIYQYMLSLERLIRLMTRALGFELKLLQEIVAKGHTRPLLSPERRDQLAGTLKRRRASTAEFIMGNRSMELLVQASQDDKESGSSRPV